MGCGPSSLASRSLQHHSPQYVSNHSSFGRELLHNISNFVEPVHHNRKRAPSINLSGRLQASYPQPAAVSYTQPSTASLTTAPSVKSVPGTQLEWTPSRKFLEEELQEANNNPGPGNLSEERRLGQRLGQLNLDVFQMVGDGNCQFRAIAANLFGDQQHHMYVREKVVRYMYANKREFAPFLGEDWEQYMQDMGQPGTWGDELTLRACCDAYQIMINVITSDEQHWFMRYKPKAKLRLYKGSPREIFLTYIAPVHYNAIRRRSSQHGYQTAGANGYANQHPQSIPEAPNEGGSQTESPFAAVQHQMIDANA